MVPDLANYRRDGYDFDARYEDGLANHKEKRVMDILIREGPTLSKDLKRLAGFCKDVKDVLYSYNYTYKSILFILDILKGFLL